VTELEKAIKVSDALTDLGIECTREMQALARVMCHPGWARI